MIEERSCGALIFFLKNNIPNYLLLKYPTYWGFVKGNIEKNEDERKTVLRETKEEANISKIQLIEGFKEEIGYFYKFEGKIIKKKVIFLLGKISEEESKKVKISFEHEAFKFCNYEDALKMFRHKNEKQILEKADKFLKEYKKQKRLL